MIVFRLVIHFLNIGIHNLTTESTEIVRHCTQITQQLEVMSCSLVKIRMLRECTSNLKEHSTVKPHVSDKGRHLCYTNHALDNSNHANVWLGPHVDVTSFEIQME